MTKTQYECCCQQHDWLFENTDSFESPRYKEGEKEREKLLQTAKDKPELQEIYDEFNPY